MNILLSNDDGYDAQGLTCLQKTLEKIANVTVVAPDTQRSATGHSVTLNKPLRIKKLLENFYTVSGTPTDSIKLGLLHILKEKKPDFIVSGINHGGNLGEDITYSGTVANAIEGSLNGIPSIAVSLVVKNFQNQPKKRDEPLYFETAAKFTVMFLEHIKSRKFPLYTFFNINVPNLPWKELQGISFTSLGRRCYGDNVVEMTDPYGKPMYWITGTEFKLFDDRGTDSSAIINNHISITPLNLDFTDHACLEEMKKNLEIIL